MKKPRDFAASMWPSLIVLVALILGWVAYSWVVYGDPMCAFARCMKVKELKND